MSESAHIAFPGVYAAGMVTGAIGRRVRELRANRRWSIADLARRANLTESAVYKIETNPNAQPQPNTLASLARALDVSADELLGLSPIEHT